MVNGKGKELNLGAEPPRIKSSSVPQTHSPPSCDNNFIDFISDLKISVLTLKVTHNVILGKEVVIIPRPTQYNESLEIFMSKLLQED